MCNKMMYETLYFGKRPGFAEPWLSTKTGGGSKYKN